jgi:poly(beta-D-mannuronate) lyase
LASFQLVACQATAEGALPLELERGRKATEYHLYALSALVMLAELAEANGRAGYGQCDGAIHRSIGFSLAALADPARIMSLAGAAQESADGIVKPSRIAFLEPYLARFPDRAVAARNWLDRRPLGLTDLGGNLTLLYGPGQRMPSRRL